MTAKLRPASKREEPTITYSVASETWRFIAYICVWIVFFSAMAFSRLFVVERLAAGPEIKGSTCGPFARRPVRLFSWFILCESRDPTLMSSSSTFTIYTTIRIARLVSNLVKDLTSTLKHIFKIVSDLAISVPIGITTLLVNWQRLSIQSLSILSWFIFASIFWTPS